MPAFFRYDMFRRKGADKGTGSDDFLDRSVHLCHCKRSLRDLLAVLQQRLVYGAGKRAKEPLDNSQFQSAVEGNIILKVLARLEIEFVCSSLPFFCNVFTYTGVKVRVEQVVICIVQLIEQRLCARIITRMQLHQHAHDCPVPAFIRR